MRFCINIVLIFSSVRHRYGKAIHELRWHHETDELDRRIDTFLARKQEKYPELTLRPQAQPKAKSMSETLAEVISGVQLEFSRSEDMPSNMFALARG